MAHSPDTSVQNERLLSAHEPNSNAEIRRASKDSITRLERIIADQEDRVKKMRHQSVGNRSQTLRLRASMKDLLQTYKFTLLQIRQSTEHLEISWAMLE